MPKTFEISLELLLLGAKIAKMKCDNDKSIRRCVHESFVESYLNVAEMSLKRTRPLQRIHQMDKQNSKT